VHRQLLLQVFAAQLEQLNTFLLKFEVQQLAVLLTDKVDFVVQWGFWGGLGGVAGQFARGLLAGFEQDLTTDLLLRAEVFEVLQFVLGCQVEE
jgi:hypothetical protein